jgi:hypothetical protein
MTKQKRTKNIYDLKDFDNNVTKKKISLYLMSF